MQASKDVWTVVNSPQIGTTIRSFHLREAEEDTRQDLALRIIESNYLERYNASKATFSTWMYGMVLNVLRSKWSKEHSEYSRRVEMPDTNSYSQRFQTDLDIPILLDQLEDQLKDTPPSSYSSNGTPRSLFQVFTMLREGFIISEIAQELETSVQYVYYMVNRMRAILRDTNNELGQS